MLWTRNRILVIINTQVAGVDKTRNRKMATRATVRFLTTVGCFGPGRPAPSFVGNCPIMFAQRTQYPCCLPSWKSSAKLVLRLHDASDVGLEPCGILSLIAAFRCHVATARPLAVDAQDFEYDTVLALCPTVAISSLGSGPPALQCRFRTCCDKSRYSVDLGRITQPPRQPNSPQLKPHFAPEISRITRVALGLP